MYVHLVAHTHDDVGWLKSPEELFVGARQTEEVKDKVKKFV